MKRNIIILLVFTMACMLFCTVVRASDTIAFTLDEAVKYALEHNKAIESAKQKVKEAEAGVVISRAGFFPTLSASGSYTRLARAPSMSFQTPVYGMVPVYELTGNTQTGWAPGITGATDSTISMGSADNYVLRASFQYPLFTWFAVTNAYKISDLSFDVTKEDLHSTENNIRASVKEAFMGVQVAEIALDLANRSYKQLQEHVSQAEELYNAGTISKFDYLRAKVQLTAVKVQAMQAKNGLAMSKDALKNYLNIDYNNDIITSGKLAYVPYEISLEQALSEAFVNRPEIKNMDLAVKIAERAVDIADAGNKPAVVLAGNYDYKNPNSSGAAEWGTDWSATLSVNIPIFQGLGDFGKVDQAKAQLNQARIGKEELKKGLAMEIRNTYLQLVSSRDLFLSQQESVGEAKEALDIAAQRYTSGLITNLEYLDAQVALSMAEMNSLKTLADYLIAIARLEKAMGR